MLNFPYPGSLLHSANCNASTHGRPCANPCGSDAHAGAHRNFATNPYVRTGANYNALAYINAAAYTYASPYSCTATHAYANPNGHASSNPYAGTHGYADAPAYRHTNPNARPAQPDYRVAAGRLAGTQPAGAGGTNPAITLD